MFSLSLLCAPCHHGIRFAFTRSSRADWGPDAARPVLAGTSHGHVFQVVGLRITVVAHGDLVGLSDVIDLDLGVSVGIELCAGQTVIWLGHIGLADFPALVETVLNAENMGNAGFPPCLMDAAFTVVGVEKSIIAFPSAGHPVIGIILVAKLLL